MRKVGVTLIDTDCIYLNGLNFTDRDEYLGVSLDKE